MIEKSVLLVADNLLILKMAAFSSNKITIIQ